MFLPQKTTFSETAHEVMDTINPRT